MEKQEFCMEKSQIFQEMISRISKLSQDSYLMVTDMQHNLTFVPESTAEFLGIPSGWCEDGYKIVLEKSVHPYDRPEYTEEMKKRLRGINLENDLYIRMGKDKKYVMTQIITDMIVTPKIMGKAMGLNPAILLLSLSVWGSLLGFIGLIIALPLTTLIIAYWKRYVTKEEEVRTSSPKQKAVKAEEQP